MLKKIIKGWGIVGICISLVGLGFLFAGVNEGYTIYTLKKRGIVTVGTVDSIYVNTYNGKITVYVVSFYTAESKEKYLIENRVGFNDSRYKKSDKIPVMYLKDEPQNGRISDFIETFIIWVGPSATGIAILLLSFILIKYSLKND